MDTQLTLFPELPEQGSGYWLTWSQLEDSDFDDDKREDEPRQPVMDPQTGFYA